MTGSSRIAELTQINLLRVFGRVGNFPSLGLCSRMRSINVDGSGVSRSMFVRLIYSLVKFADKFGSSFINVYSILSDSTQFGIGNEEDEMTQLVINIRRALTNSDRSGKSPAQFSIYKRSPELEDLFCERMRRK